MQSSARCAVDTIGYDCQRTRNTSTALAAAMRSRQHIYSLRVSSWKPRSKFTSSLIPPACPLREGTGEQSSSRASNNMNTQHTPGPWIAQGLSIFDGQNSTPLAQVYERFYRRGDERPACEREGAAANARLIAAAPELLDACLKVANDPYTTCQCAEVVRAAIAKATGN